MIEKRSQKAPFLLFFHMILKGIFVQLFKIQKLCQNMRKRRCLRNHRICDSIMLSSVDWLTPLIVASLLMEMPRSSQSVRIRFL